jgi:retron-type reverse transcriptase
MASISPVPKAGDLTLPENWRPINILNVVSKIAERHFLGILEDYILPKLSPHQFGFLRHRSTEDAILYAEHSLKVYYKKLPDSKR